MATKNPTTYWDYIQVEPLLSLQKGIAEDESEIANDEVMFITIHQIDELWFKLALRELAATRDLFAAESVAEQSLSEVVRGLRRAVLLFKQVASHFELMETLTTRDYLSFRDKLSPASGFQSAQLREIEIILGLQASERIPLGKEDYFRALKYPDGSDSPASMRVKARLEDRPSLLEALDNWLYRTPIHGSLPSDANADAALDEAINGFLDAHAREIAKIQALAVEHALTEPDRERLAKRFEGEVASARSFMLAEDIEDEAERRRRSRIRAALLFIESYRELPLLAWPREILDSIVALEQAFVIFRQRHARMVERVIGRRTGTGGSAGVAYLDQTALRYRVFRDVWAVRTLLLRKGALPELRNASHYGFAEGYE